MRLPRRFAAFAPLGCFLALTAHCDNASPKPDPQSPATATSVTGAPPPAASAAMPDPAPANSASNTESAPTASPEAIARLAKDSNAFGFDVYQKLRAKKGNVVFSPASITTALSMTWGGAKGETAAQMQKALHLEGTPAEVMNASGALAAQLTDPNRPIKFRIANRLFSEKTYELVPDYLAATKAAYGAALEPVDFLNGAEGARAHINGWVEEQTEKRIQNLIPPGGVDKSTRLVLVNAIYFLGDWQSPFEKDKTKPAPFSVGGASKKDVPTMSHQSRFRYAAKDGVKAVELPYKGGQMSMFFVLPDKVDGIGALEKSFDGAKLDALVQAAQPTQVNVSVPKFEINPSSSIPLGDVLKELGMKDAFGPNADFTGIANPAKAGDRLFIGAVFHKAFVKVDEKGTEAAAATSVGMRTMAMPMPQAPPVEFKADHPFLFFIRDNASGMVLFSGRVTDPSAT